MTADRVATLLTRSEGSVLGKRRLIVPWGNGVQWQPGDDACVACSLAVERRSSRTAPALDGVVLAVEPMPPQPSNERRRSGPSLIFEQSTRRLRR